MFNKKFVSLISALAMALSMCSFVSVQAADVPAADLEFKVEKNIFDQETFEEAGIQEYTITVSLKTENIGLTDNGKSGALKRYSGSKVITLAGRINFDTTKFYTDDSMMTGMVENGMSTMGAISTGATFSWLTTKATEGLEGEVELFKINLYAQDPETGAPTLGPDDEFESLFTWDTTTRSVSYCEWTDVKNSELAIDSPKVLGDNKGEGGWVGDLGITKPLPETTAEVVNEYELLEDGGYAWDVLIKNFDSTKTYATIFKAGEETREVGDNELTVDAFAETTGDLGFVVLMKTSKANVTLNIEVQ